MTKANAVGGRMAHLVDGPARKGNRNLNVNREAVKRREADVLSLVCRTLQAYPEAYAAVREAMRQAGAVVVVDDVEAGRRQGR